MYKNKKNAWIILSITLLTSCSKLINLLSKEVDSEYKTGIKSKYNSDNIIFTDDKLFKYTIQQKNLNRTLNYKMELKVIPGKYTGGTKIKYKLYYNNDTGLSKNEQKLYIDSVKKYKWDITSVHEDKSGIWIHPPRSYSLEKLALSPYPEVKFPISKNRHWSQKLKIFTGWKELNGKTIISEYDLTKTYYSSDSLIGFAEIRATSKIEDSLLCISKFYFNTKDGFTKLYYEFTDKESIVFELQRNK